MASQSNNHYSEVSTPYGPLPASVFARLFPEPIVAVQEWQWARPFPGILKFLDFTIDQVIDSRCAGAYVRTLWKIWNAAQRLTAERRTREDIALQLWWRGLGCRTPCPLCESCDPCHCAEQEPWAELLRDPGTGHLGDTSSGVWA